MNDWFSHLKHLSPIRPWMGTITPASLRADLIAGLTNATIVLPQGVAFAIIAGLPPQYGLFTAMIGTFVAAIWGASSVMVSGPTTAISAVVFATVSEFASPESSDYVTLVLLLTLMVGLLQLTAGLIGLGSLISFISHSVIVAFTAAAAFLIAVSQLGPAIGLESGHGGAIQRLASIWQNLGDINPAAAAISAVTLACLIGINAIDKRIPAYVVALVVGSLVGVIIGTESAGVRTFAALTSAFPTFSPPEVDFDSVGLLLPGAVAVAFVGLLEAISIGKSFAIRRDESHDANQEIVGQGMSNTIGSFFQCYAGSGSFTRSGLNASSGAVSPLSAIFAAVSLALLLLLVAPLLQFVPVPAMAAIILYVAWKLINFAEIRHILRSSRSETLILLVTFVTGLVSELDFAILAGVLVSLSVFLNKSAHPIVSVGAPTAVNGRRVFMNASAQNLPQCPQISNTRLDGPLFFGSVEHVAQAFKTLEQGYGPRTRILNLKGVGKIDLTGADFLLNQLDRARRNGRDLHLIAANPQVLDVLERFGIIAKLSESNLHNHKSTAIEAAVLAADDDICAGCRLRIFHECAGKAKPPDLP